MNPSRTTKEITTPSGNKVVIYDYMTGGELRKIQALYLENVTAADVMTPDGMKSVMSKIAASTLARAQELALELLLVSVDGNTQKPYEAAMDLKEEDLNFLIKEADQYTSGTVPKKN